MVTNNILYHHQFGFRQQHSMTQKLLVFLSDVHSALNDYNCSQKHSTAYHIIDSRAFDEIVEGWYRGKFVEMVQRIPIQQIPTCMYK